MKTKFKYLALGVFLITTIPAMASSVLGRLEVSWPDFNDPAGAPLVTEIQTGIAKVSDNSNSRITESSAIADSATVTITHNFELNFEDLSLLFYTGVGSSKVLADYVANGYTIADNGGDPKNKIDVTAPGSGGPHDFSTILSWGGGSGGDGLTKSYPLIADIDKGSFVRVVDDGGTAKIKGVFDLIDRADSLGNIETTSNSQTKMAYGGSPGIFINTYIKTNDFNSPYALVVDYNGGTPVYGTPFKVDSVNAGQMCIAYSPINKTVVMVTADSAAGLQWYLLEANGTSLTLLSSLADPSVDVNTVINCTTNTKTGNVHFIFTDINDAGNTKLVAINTDGGTLTKGSYTTLANTSSKRDVFYSPIYDKIITFQRTANTLISLFNSPDINTHTLLDSDISIVNGYGSISAIEDPLNGGIPIIYDDISLGGNNLFHRALDISGGAIVLAAPITVGLGAQETLSQKLLVSFNTFDGLGHVFYETFDFNTFNNNAHNTTITSTLSLSSLAAPSIVIGQYFGQSSSASFNYNSQSAFCGQSPAGSTEVKCDFRGGEKIFDSTNNIGVFVSANSLAGSIGDVVLYGGITDQLTGTIGAPIYLDESSGLFTETPFDEKRGIFLDTGELQLEFRSNNVFETIIADSLVVSSISTSGGGAVEFPTGIHVPVAADVPRTIGTVGAIANAQGALEDGDVVFANSAYYKLDGLINTATQGGDLSNINGVTFLGKGIYAREDAAEFNGIDQTLTSANVFFNAGDTDFSFSTWFIPKIFITGLGSDTIAAHSFSPTDRSWSIQVNSAGTILFWYPTSASTISNVQIPNNFIDATPHQIGITYEASTDLWKFYLDGLVVGAVTQINRTTVGNLFQLGAADSPPVEFFEGEILDATYTTDLLTESQMNALYSKRYTNHDQIYAGHPLENSSFPFTDFANRFFYWNLNSVSGTTDGSGNGKGLTQNNSPTFTGMGLLGDIGGAIKLESTMSISSNNGIFGTGPDFTVGVWIRAVDWTPSSTGDFISNFVVAGNQKGFILKNNTDGSYNILSSIDGLNTTNVLIAANPGFSNGSYHYFVLRHNQALETFDLFIDGKKEGTSPIGGPLFEQGGSPELVFGAQTSAGGSSFPGDYDEAFYVKGIMTDEDIHKIYSAKLNHNRDTDPKAQLWRATYQREDRMFTAIIENGWITTMSSNDIYVDFSDMSPGAIITPIFQ